MSKAQQNAKDSHATKVIAFTNSLLINIVVSVLTALLLGIMPFIWDYIKMDIVKNLLILGLLILCLWLFRFWLVSGVFEKSKTLYKATIEPFSTLIDRIAFQYSSFNPETSESGSVYLLHWVPTFSLSRGLNKDTHEIVPSKAPIYCHIKDLLHDTRGKIVCFDGKGIYRFLEESDILFDEPLLLADYLDEVITILKNDRITYGFLSWGMFPYTLIALGDHYAVFDFTSVSDVHESEGYKRSALRPTLRLETSAREEVLRVRKNMFLTMYDKSEKSVELRKKSIEYLEKVAGELRETRVLIMPDDAEIKYW